MQPAALRALLFVIAPIPRLLGFVAALGEEPVEQVVVACGGHAWYALTHHHIFLLVATPSTVVTNSFVHADRAGGSEGCWRGGHEPLGPGPVGSEVVQATVLVRDVLEEV